MPTVIVEAEIQVWCECGEGLCRQSSGTDGGIIVEPCKKCIDSAKDEGHSEGYDEGWDKGFSDGENS